MSERMPAIFIGHGSPMNAVENNQYTEQWIKAAAKIKKPEVILAVSAHWYTSGTRITDSPKPNVVYDMYGFPPSLYDIAYQPEGAPALAKEIQRLIGQDNVAIDNTWGIDHGTWSVLCRMYPHADIPALQLSINKNADAKTHFEIGRKLSSLRSKGVLILGSGNIVHNLSRLDWNMNSGYPWAQEFDSYIKENIIKRQFDKVIDYSKVKSSELAFYTPDHFYPLLYVLGASNNEDELLIFNDSCVLGSLSMTCCLFE